MKLTRRNFLAWAGLSAVGAVACDVFEDELRVQSPVSLPEDLVKGKENWYATLCRTCPSSEGVVVRVVEGRAKKIQGNPNYPTNMGAQSARCDLGLQQLYHPDRLTGPVRLNGPKGSGRFDKITWDRALEALKKELQDRDGAVAMITPPLRGHAALISDNFVKAFGGKRIEFDSLDLNTYKQAIENVFGKKIQPYYDISNAKYVLSFGSDFLSTWISPTQWEVAYGQFRDSKHSDRGTLTHVDSRFSVTASNADRWIPIKPGQEGKLALSIAYVLIEEKLTPSKVDIDDLTDGKGLSALASYHPDNLAAELGIPEHITGSNSVSELIRTVAREFASQGPAIAIGGGSAGASTNGLFNLEAIYLLNHLVGSVGIKGGVILNPDSPIKELSAGSSSHTITDVENLIKDIKSSKIKMLIINGTNPVYGLPNWTGLKEALENEDVYLVSFDYLMNETNNLSNLILPDRNFMEEWGDDIPEPASGYQVIGIQQPIVNPLSDLDPRSSSDVMLSVAQDLGKDSDLPWKTLQEAMKSMSDQLFDLNRGSVPGSTKQEFWNNLLKQGGWWDEGATESSSVDVSNIVSNIVAKDKGAAVQSTGEFYLVPFEHNSLLDGRNGDIPWAQATPDPVTSIAWQTWVEINEKKANDMGIQEGDVLKVQSENFEIKGIAFLSPAQPPEVISIPLGQGRTIGSSYATNRLDGESANVLDMLENHKVNETGSLAWAATKVNVINTNTSLRIAKFEGDFESREIGFTEGEKLIKTTSPNGNNH
jgi:anaerobic selenocysteine-containing dehydrogenase